MKLSFLIPRDLKIRDKVDELELLMKLARNIICDHDHEKGI